MLSYYGIIDKYQTTKAWYDGYLFGKTEIYCPWDVLNHCDTVVHTDDAEPKAYWIIPAVTILFASSLKWRTPPQNPKSSR